MRLAQFRVRHVVLGVMSLLLIMLILTSLNRRMEHDTAWFLQIARLMDQHGYVPYRDFVEINMPGTFFSYIAIGRITGYTDELRLRLFDVAYFSAISAMTWLWLSRLGRSAAWAAIVLFGVFYFSGGTAILLQRDYLLILPIAAAVTLVMTRRPSHWALRAFVVGVLFGLSATIKPHASIGLAVVWAAMGIDMKSADESAARFRVRLLISGVAALAGISVPIGLVVFYLIQNGAWAPFMEMATKYLPIYARLSHHITMIAPSERPLYLLTEFIQFGGFFLWWFPALAGLIAVMRSAALTPPAKRQVWLMLALVTAYAIYPVLSGQFFVYHWLPFMYFIIPVASLCLSEPAASSPNRWRIAASAAAVLVSVIMLVVPLAGRWYEQVVEKKTPNLAEIDTADGIVAYLNQHQKPGERIQPIDWGQGAKHAMLLTDSLPATPYIDDVIFFMDITSPYTHEIRLDFVRYLRAASPPFVVDVTGQLIPTGPGASREFPELTAFLDEQYAITYIGHGFAIYEPSQGISQALIVYPLDEAETLKGFRTNQPDVFALTSQRAGDTDYIVSRVSDLAGSHDLITVEFPTGQPDPGGVIERWLAEHAFKLPETRIQDNRVLNYLIGEPACQEDQAVGAEFGEVMNLETVAYSLMAVRDESIVCIQIGWRALEATPISYKIATHIVAPDGSIIAQYDSVPMGYLSPTTTWTAGQQIMDRYAIPLPADLAAGTYTIRVIVYDESTGERLTVGGDIDFVKVGDIEIR